MDKRLFLLVIISVIVGSVVGSIIGAIFTLNFVKNSNTSNKVNSNTNVLYKQTVVIKEADKNTFVKVIEEVKPAVARVDVITSDTPWSKDWDDFFKYFLDLIGIKCLKAKELDQLSLSILINII